MGGFSVSFLFAIERLLIAIGNLGPSSFTTEDDS